MSLRLPKVPNGPWRKEYPFKSRYLDLGHGQAMHYLDEGQGPPVIMVHGNPSWSFMFRRLVQALPGFRRLVPDHLGMGLSSRPGGHYGFTLKERLDDFGQWAESLDLTEPAHLIVHDWGGPIGLGWASQNPGRVASLTVMNTGLRVPKGFKVPLKLAIFRLSPFLGRLMATELNIFVKGVTRHGTVRPLAPEAIEGFLAPYGLPSHREGIYGFVDDIPLKGKGCSETLAGIDQGFGLLADKPTLFVWGLRDFVFTKHFLDDFTQRLPQAQVIPLPRAGHWLLEDEPLAIAKAIKAFLPRR